MAMVPRTEKGKAPPLPPRRIDGAVGAGLVLVFLPGLALFFGIEWIGRTPGAGLPVLAIFGIMILFGALALTSTLFTRLGLHDPAEALALPAGSIRAAVTLSLIVLFAIISIMLYQSMLQTRLLSGLSAAEKELIVKEPKNQVVAVLPGPCIASAPAGQDCERRYEVELSHGPGQDASDLAKQLLTLIGTLVTALTSFYFAAKTAAPPKKDDAAPATPPPVAPDPVKPIAADAAASGEEHKDGCDVPIDEATPDHELPAAKGGVV